MDCGYEEKNCLKHVSMRKVNEILIARFEENLFVSDVG